MNVDPAVLAEVQSIVAEVLACEPEEATPHARFFNDLGGESIDFLDLTFRCEKHFRVKLGMEKMLDAEYAATDEAGVLTPEVVEEIQSFFRRCIDDLTQRIGGPEAEARAFHVMATLEGGMMLARAYRDIGAFDQAVASLT